QTNSYAQRAQTSRLDPTDLFKKASVSVVTIATPTAFGSGVLVEASGVIVTNFHVIRGAERATVTLANHDRYDGVEVVDVDARKDIALLKITGFHLPAAEMFDSDQLAIGQQVYAIGAPQGLELTLTAGLVSGIR